MKTLLFILLFLSCSYAQTYTFLVDKYDKEVELESKIIHKIAESSVSKKIILFIPQITNKEKDIYSKIFKLGKNCKESNFVFIKKTTKEKDLCSSENKLYFTNNYKKLLSNSKYFGAFFWNKSRPNIVFIKNRLIKHNIKLPYSYKQFIEDL